MLHSKLPSLVPSHSGSVPASKSATTLCAYMVSNECHLPVLQGQQYSGTPRQTRDGAQTQQALKKTRTRTSSRTRASQSYGQL